MVVRLGQYIENTLIKQLDQFHMRCLRKIGNIKWQDMIPNTEVLKKCNMPGIEALLLQAQLRWCGHLVRIKDDRIPRTVFYGQLKKRSRTAGGQKLRFKDTLKSNLKSCNIDISNWEAIRQTDLCGDLIAKNL